MYSINATAHICERCQLEPQDLEDPALAIEAMDPAITWISALSLASEPNGSGLKVRLRQLKR